jgi:CRP-like cAMP-binding protein
MKGYRDSLRVFSMKLIQSVDYLSTLTDASLEEVSYHLQTEHYEPNKVVFRAGDPIDAMYFIVHGVVNISVNVNDREVIIDSINQGCSVGCNGILGHFNHNFTARASSKVTLYYLTKDSLKTLMNTCHDLDSSVTTTQEHYQSTDMPWVDFRMSRLKVIKLSPNKILRTSIARLLRLKRSLNNKHSAEEIMQILKELQIKYNRPGGGGEDDEGGNSANVSIEMFTKLMKRFDIVQEEIKAQRRLIKHHFSKGEDSPKASINGGSKWDDPSHKKKKAIDDRRSSKYINKNIDKEVDQIIDELDLSMNDQKSTEDNKKFSD